MMKDADVERLEEYLKLCIATADYRSDEREPKELLEILRLSKRGHQVVPEVPPHATS